MQVRLQYARSITLVRQFSGKHLVEDDAEHVDIAGRSDDTLILFGRQVSNGPKYGRLHCKCRVIEYFCQSEIHQCQLPIEAYEQIAGLDIAMHNSSLMSIIQG